MDQANNKTRQNDNLKINNRKVNPLNRFEVADEKPKDLSLFFLDNEKFAISLWACTPTPNIFTFIHALTYITNLFGGIAARNAKEPKKAPAAKRVKPNS